MYNDMDEKKVNAEETEAVENRENIESVESVESLPTTEEVKEPEKENTKCYYWETPVETSKPEEKKKKKGGAFRKLLLAVGCGLCFGLFAGVGLFTVDWVVDWYKLSGEEVYQTNSEESIINKVEDKKEQSIQLSDKSYVTVVTSDYSDVVERVMPAMVSIVNTYVERINYWGQTNR